MDDKHKTHDLSHGECAQCDDVLTHKKKQDKAHSSVRVDVLALCGSQWQWSCRHWCRYRDRAMSPRNLTNSEFSLLVQL